MNDPLDRFFKEDLGYQPKDRALFDRARTHSSLRSANYERLEFLGDRVLGLIIARMLYERYPDEPEGNLSRRYNVLVGRETCAAVGRAMNVPAVVRLGKQARDDRANQSDNIIGDVVEALIGALLLDGGMAAAQRFVEHAWASFFDGQSRAPQHPKSALQELAAARGCKPPVYEVLAQTGAHHAPRFTVKVTVPKLGEASAEGSTKQEAETAAAAALLLQTQ